VPVGELRIGERLKARDGSTPKVLSFTKRPEPEPVFNIEVDGDHVYRVGEQGLLVHNASADATTPPGKPEDQPCGCGKGAGATAVGHAALRTELKAVADGIWADIQTAQQQKPKENTITRYGYNVKTNPSRGSDYWHGPCLSIAKDLKTGKIYVGQNWGKVVPYIDKLLEDRRVEFIKAGNPAFIPYGRGTAGSHSEIDAVSQALRDRRAGGETPNECTLAEIAIYNLATIKYEGSPVGSDKVPCTACAPILRGVIDLTDPQCRGGN
jgi:YwqJ-like deaminase